jgi:hypothetical protein
MIKTWSTPGSPFRRERARCRDEDAIRRLDLFVIAVVQVLTETVRP